MTSCGFPVHKSPSEKGSTLNENKCSKGWGWGRWRGWRGGGGRVKLFPVNVETLQKAKRFCRVASIISPGADPEEVLKGSVEPPFEPKFHFQKF